MATATHITNRLPTKANHHQSPYQLWTGKIPAISHLRVFGRAYAHIPDQKRSKLDPKAAPCIFLGYAPEQKGYLLQDEQTGKLITSRDVSFDEHLLPKKPRANQDIVERQGEDMQTFTMPSTTPSTPATASSTGMPQQIPSASTNTAPETKAVKESNVQQEPEKDIHHRLSKPALQPLKDLLSSKTLPAGHQKPARPVVDRHSQT